jgi:hypothetical protein
MTPYQRDRYRYGSAGLGLTLLGWAIAFGVITTGIESITGAPEGSVAPALLAIPFLIVTLAVGIMVFAFSLVLHVVVPLAVIGGAKTAIEAARGPKAQPKRTPVAGDPCYHCSFRSPTGADLFNEYGSMLFCIDRAACIKRGGPR